MSNGGEGKNWRIGAFYEIRQKGQNLTVNLLSRDIVQGRCVYSSPAVGCSYSWYRYARLGVHAACSIQLYGYISLRACAA